MIFKLKALGQGKVAVVNDWVLPEIQLAIHSHPVPSENRNRARFNDKVWLLRWKKFYRIRLKRVPRWKLNENYRHVGWWKAHQVKEHCVHDSAHFCWRRCVPHSRAGEWRVEQDPARAEPFENFLTQLNAFPDVRVFAGRRYQTAGGMKGEEEQCVEGVIGSTDQRFPQFSP